MSAVEMRGISKSFGTVQALNDVDFTLKQGEIHAVLGENGAGKTTLMKVLYGMHKPDRGEVLIRGEKKKFRDSSDAIQAGIGMVHQHFMLVPVLSVAENIVACCEPRKGLFYDHEQAVRNVTELAQKSGFHIDARAKVENLSVGQMQRVEILKALYRGVEILILDEPTAVLTPIEVQELFKALRELRAAGKSIVIITHKLYEVMEIADRCTVLRDGTFIGSVDKKDTDMRQLASMMVGREYSFEGRHPSECIGEVLCQVKNLSYQSKGIPVLDNVALSVHRGEILGIAGIDGNGQTELIEAMTGLLQPDSMELTLNGKQISGNAAAFLASGIGHVPEDRTARGLSLARSIEENMILGYESQSRFCRKGIMRHKSIRKNADDLISAFRVKAPNAVTPCGALSGGNQQKVVIARVFSQDPEVVVCAQPTRGVDVSASEYIHEVMLEYRNRGKGIILISADLDEIKKLSDTIAVIHKGRIVAIDRAENFDDNRLGLLMTGAVQEEKEE